MEKIKNGIEIRDIHFGCDYTFCPAVFHDPRLLKIHRKKIHENSEETHEMKKKYDEFYKYWDSKTKLSAQNLKKHFPGIIESAQNIFDEISQPNFGNTTVHQHQIGYKTAEPEISVIANKTNICIKSLDLQAKSSKSESSVTAVPKTKGESGRIKKSRKKENHCTIKQEKYIKIIRFLYILCKSLMPNKTKCFITNNQITKRNQPSVFNNLIKGEYLEKEIAKLMNQLKVARKNFLQSRAEVLMTKEKNCERIKGKIPDTSGQKMVKKAKSTFEAVLEPTASNKNLNASIPSSNLHKQYSQRTKSFTNNCNSNSKLSNSEATQPFHSKAALLKAKKTDNRMEEVEKWRKKDEQRLLFQQKEACRRRSQLNQILKMRSLKKLANSNPMEKTEINL